MNFTQVKKAFLAGHVVSDATGSNVFQMNIARLCARGRKDFLAQDLRAEITALIEQVETLQGGGSWALVCECPCPTLTFRTVAIECPNAESDALTNDFNKIHTNQQEDPSESKGGSSHHLANGSDVPSEPKPTSPGIPEVSLNGTRSTKGSNLEPEPSQPEIQLQITSDENSENAALVAASILTSYHSGSLTTYEQVESEIYKSPLPGLTRNIAAKANQKWMPTSTSQGVICWERIPGIHDPLPLENPLGLTAFVVDVGIDNLGKLMVQTLHQPRFASLISESAVGPRKYLPITIATADIRSVLAYGMANSLAIRVAVSVERRIASGAKASFVAIAAHCIEPTDNEEREKIKQLAMVATRRPDQFDLWSS